MNFYKNCIAAAVLFISLAVLLVAQQFTGTSIVGIKLGAQGGSGDVVGPSSAADGEMTLFNGTTGKLIKRAAMTGVLRASAGVPYVVTGTGGDCVKVDGTSGPCGTGGGGGGSYTAGDGISIISDEIAVDATVPAKAASGSQSLTYGTIAANGCGIQTMAAPGAVLNDAVLIVRPVTLPNYFRIEGWVSATDVVSVQACKDASGSGAINGLTFGYQIWRVR